MYHTLARTGVGAALLTTVAIVMGTVGFIARVLGRKGHR